MINWIRGWWDEQCDSYSDKHSGRALNEVPLWKLRWTFAEWFNRHTDRCWASLSDFALGWSLRLGGKDTTRCKESALDTGTCYCGKYISEKAAKVVSNPDERIVVR